VRGSKVACEVATVVALVLSTFGVGIGVGAEAAQASSSARHGASKNSPLVAPKTSPVIDARYLTDVAKADPSLAPYVQEHGNVALKAVLTDGSAFCAFLERGGGIDNALLNVAAGAKSVESTTHLPFAIATFNAIEAVALIDLCPGEQRLVPASVRVKLRRLRSALHPAAG
jgi:hypothetical protein